MGRYIRDSAMPIDKALAGRHVLLVVAPDGFAEDELGEVRARLAARGAVVEVASTALVARGDAGTEMAPEVALAATDAHRYAAVAVLGGRGAPVHLWENGPLHAVLRLAREDGAVLGGLALGAPALARAGVLGGVRATTFGGLLRARHELLRAGALYVEEDLVTDRGVVTAASPESAGALADALADAVASAVGRPAAPERPIASRRERSEARRMFLDRTEAGVALAGELAGSVASRCVVAAIPHGGIAVGLPVARRLGVPLTVVYARKLSAPVAAEVAFGALDEDGEVLTSPDTVEALGLTDEDVAESRRRVLAEIRRRMGRYRVPPLSTYLPAPVVLVDDGLATGLTMEAAVRYARRHGATDVTVAVPCASADAARLFRHEADRFVGLVVDDEFAAVGQYYHDFSPVTDDEVVAMLERARLARARASAGGDRLLSFRNARGYQLAGELLLPAGAGPFPVVVFAHGWQSGKESPRNRAAAQALRAAGFAAFLFDFTGHGESEGTLEESTPAQQVDDLGAAIDAAAAQGGIDPTRLGVVGASSGGAVALLRASVDTRIGALVLRSANPAGAEDAARRVEVPVLLVVGEHDAATRAANETLAARLAGPHRLEVVPGGDHLFEDPAALHRAVEAMVEWFSRQLPPEPDVRPRHGAA